MSSITTRSSARIRQKQLSAAKDLPVAPHSRKRPSTDQSPTTSVSKLSPAKRRKVAQRNEAGSSTKPKPVVLSRSDGRVRGRRGHLQLMTEMPIDILYEIFNVLEPIDLLHLSWASMSLHNIVMSKSARFLWDNAFKEVYSSGNPPPSCPSDLNLAQYTRLLFDKRCMMCYSPHGSHVAWMYRMRVCATCLETDHFTVLTGPLSYRFWAVLPLMRTFVHGKYQTYCLTSDYNAVKEKMDTLGQDSDGWKEFSKQKADWMSTRRKDEWSYMQWQRNQKKGRKNVLESIRIERRDAIIARLKELGWEEELNHLNGNQLWTLPGMRIAKPLTDKAWQALCPEVIEHLELVRELRLERKKQDRMDDRSRELHKKIWSWAKKQKEPSLMPKFLDLAFTQPFWSYISEDTETKPKFIEDDEEFERCMVLFTEEWNESRNQVLLSLLPKHMIPKSSAKGKGKAKALSGSDILDRAIVLFQCVDCNEAIAYPRVLAHKCQSVINYPAHRRDTDSEELVNFTLPVFTRPWLSECDDLSFDEEASSIAASIVKECGEDPQTVTSAYMDEKNYRLECVRCFDKKRGRLLMNWRMATQHELEKHSGEHKIMTSSRSQKGKARQKIEPVLLEKWRIVTAPGDLAIAAAEEQEASTTNHRRAEIECKHCRLTISPEPWSLQSHWRYTHPRDDVHVPEDLVVETEEELRQQFQFPLDTPVKTAFSPVRISARSDKPNEINDKEDVVMD